MRSLTILGCLGWLLCCGCGGSDGDSISYAPVSGVVQLDGKPIEGATVTFSPKDQGSMSLALTDAAGKFVLKTASGKRGAVVGDHTVTVTLVIELGGTDTPAQAPSATDLAAPLPNEEGATVKPKSAISTTRYIVPERYSKPGALSATVPSGGLVDHQLDLTTK